MTTTLQNMSNKTLTNREAETLITKGLQNYLYAGKRIEYLTVSRSTEDKTPIAVYFDRLVSLMHQYYKNSNLTIEFFFINVNNQHIHAFIKKPFIERDILIAMWNRITGTESNIRCDTIFAKLKESTKRKIKNHVDYTITQDQKHETTRITYHYSSLWGYVKLSKRQSKETGLTELSLDTKQIIKARKISKQNVINRIKFQPTFYDAVLDPETGQITGFTQVDNKGNQII